MAAMMEAAACWAISSSSAEWYAGHRMSAGSVADSPMCRPSPHGEVLYRMGWNACSPAVCDRKHPLTAHDGSEGHMYNASAPSCMPAQLATQGQSELHMSSE